MIWEDENKQYQIVFEENFSVIKLHDAYHNSIKGYNLSDVDLIIINEDEVIFVEYKNYDIGNNEPPNNLEKNDKLHNKIAKKYYDSYLSVKSIPNYFEKKFIYYFIMENRNVESALRIPMYDKIKKKLPFKLHESLLNDTIPFIDQFKIRTISQWNNEFPQFKLERI